MDEKLICPRCVVSFHLPDSCRSCCSSHLSLALKRRQAGATHAYACLTHRGGVAPTHMENRPRRSQEFILSICHSRAAANGRIPLESVQQQSRLTTLPPGGQTVTGVTSCCIEARALIGAEFPPTPSRTSRLCGVRTAELLPLLRGHEFIDGLHTCLKERRVSAHV